MNKSLLFFLLCATLESSLAQQWPLSALYHSDQARWINSFAGLEGVHVATLNHRDQWNGLIGRPAYSSAGWNGPMRQWGGAAGLYGSIDRLGLQKSYYFRGSYNRVLSFDQFLLSLGFGLAFQSIDWDAASIRTPEGLYGSGQFDHNDPNLANSSLSHRNLEWSPSVTLQSAWLDLGLEWTMPILQWSANPNRIFHRNHVLKGLIAREFSFNKILIQPQLLWYSDLIKFQTEALVRMDYQDILTFYALFRGYNRNSWDAVGAGLGLRIHQGVWIYFGLETSIGSIGNPPKGFSQDFGLKYQWNAKKSLAQIPIIYNPRW